MPDNEDLANLLRSRGRELSAWVIDDMYRNPFWESRFASRGREHAEQDAQYHITYLATAVETGTPTVMANYAAWLRNVLTSRGMCTRHLDENFERLSDAIAMDHALSANRLPFACLEAARAALIYDEELARQMKQREQDLADKIVNENASHPKFREISGLSTRDDARYLLSFCSDAIVRGSTDQLRAHLDWMQKFSSENRIDSRVLELIRAGTRETLSTTFQTTDSPDFRQVLEALDLEQPE